MEDEDGAVDHRQPLVRDEAHVIVGEALGEEPVKPGHLAPDPAHRVVPHLVRDVVEGRLEDEAGGVVGLEAEEADQVARHARAEAVAPHHHAAAVPAAPRHHPVVHLGNGEKYLSTSLNTFRTSLMSISKTDMKVLIEISTLSKQNLMIWKFS